MKKVKYNDITTSSLGFGTSFLTRNNSISEALMNLEVAFENGITHFDCARLYGYGHAEIILGKFAKNKRQSITITSKSGLYSRSLPIGMLPIINTLRSLKNFSFKKNISKKRAPDLGVFNPINLLSDIESSLKSISTDYLDFYMLHEANVSLANQLDLIEVLKKAKQQGKIKSFGVASHYLNLVQEFEQLDSAYELIQHNSSISNLEINSLVSHNERLRIIYNIFSELNQIALSDDWKIKGHTSPVEYIFAHYKEFNRGGITIFSSTDNIRIKENIELWCRV